MEVRLAPIGDLDTTVVGEAASALRDHCDARVDADTTIPYSALDVDPRATPYDAQRVLSVEAAYDTPEPMVLLTRLPITHEGREYVFGIADAERSACLVSTYLLFRSVDGDGLTDPGTALSRLRTEVVHEVGHVLGQSHCANDQCVMSFSMGLPDIDAKSEGPCAECAPGFTPTGGRR